MSSDCPCVSSAVKPKMRRRQAWGYSPLSFTATSSWMFLSSAVIGIPPELYPGSSRARCLWPGGNLGQSKIERISVIG